MGTNKQINKRMVAKIPTPGNDSTGLGDNTVSTSKLQDAAVSNQKMATMANNTVKGNISGSTATPSDLTGTQLSTILTSSTFQRFKTPGAITYTRPSTAVKRLRVIMIGGGGGGGSSGTSGGSNVGGSNGTSSTWAVAGGAVFVTAGLGGAGPGGGNSTSGGPGGTNTINSPAIEVQNHTGCDGSTMGANVSIANASGGKGGDSPMGGGGQSTTAGVAGGAGKTNVGGGGAGAASGASAFVGLGAGGGGMVEFIIDNPSATYDLVVGAGGAGGITNSSGFTGGAGGSGIIIVEELYV